MEVQKLPYLAEYAKSGRAKCKGCKDLIAGNSLRIAAMLPSPFFDGLMANWYHYSCFFKKFRPKHVTDISHFESLRWDDQENIRQKIENMGQSPLPKSKSKKRSEQVYNIPDLSDYTIEYAKSNRSKCKLCDETILKDDIRISKRDYESEWALKIGFVERWHHVDCFVKVREELNFLGPSFVLPGFNSLSTEDQKLLRKKIQPLVRPDETDGPPSKKKKESNVLLDQMKEQNEKMINFRVALEALGKEDLICLLEYNNQDVPEGNSKILDRLSDAMAFGALKRCEDCSGQLTFRTGIGYQCLGHISEWTRCQKIYSKPKRIPFKIPADLKQEFTFLKNYKGKVSERLFIERIEKKVPAKVENKNEKPLKSLKFYVHKTESKSREELKTQIRTLGGEACSKFDSIVVAVISTNDELSKTPLPRNLKISKELGIYVLPETFFDDFIPSMSKTELLNKMNQEKLSSWDSDIKMDIKEESTENTSLYLKKSTSSSTSGVFKSNETVKKITIKDGLAVDPDSQLEQIAHVYRNGDDIYSVVLSLADVQTGRNSYYKLQILESDTKKKYWLFRAWGRIGTTMGGTKCEKYKTLDDCITVFKSLFEEKSGNLWEAKNHFKKVPGKMMILEIQYNDTADASLKPKIESKSSVLPKSVQDLITLIFDIEAMKKTMMEFELDLNKLPLGKLSQKHIQTAFGVLSELQDALSTNASRHFIIEKSNMFYTLVPHDYGIKVPLVLDNEDIIKQKVEVLNNLMEIEIAYSMLTQCDKDNNSIDDHYKKLKAKITDLDRDCEEFMVIKTYVENTHAKTHMNYSLEIENIFKVEREEEVTRYDKFRDFPNRKLLWHGSRVTNFAGILSQGLRIAPPEAPTTGYMFGKGIYFADMVSKSANYCNTSKMNPTGLLLLCEVALGDMKELTSAKYIKKLPPGKHSVKGKGKTQPNPSESVFSSNGAEIPLGKGIDTKIKSSSLLYNEYIVYNVDQVKIQYLLRLKFNHKI